jgi:hypothetical protein
MSRVSMKSNDSDSDLWADLVVSILSVNRFPLDRAFDLLQQLRAEQLTDPEELSKRTIPELYAKLITAGYNRGEFMTYLFAERLSSLGTFAKEHGIANCEKVISGHDVAALETLLLGVKGIGPAVIKNFRTLRQV